MGTAAAISAIALAACGAAPETDTTTPPAAGGTETTAAGTTEPTETETADTEAPEASGDFKACIVSDEGGFDDRSFNQLSYEGVERAVDELGIQMAEVQSDTPTDYAPNLASLVDEQCNLIVSVGFALAADTSTTAEANPDVEFVLVDHDGDADFDGEKDAENIKPLVYDTAQAAFMAGYLAAGYSEAGMVGTFGGQPFPTVTIFMDGFKQGVEYYNETKGTDVQVIGYQGGEQGSFTGGFEANNDAKSVAEGIIDQGVDVILPVGGPIYQSAIDAIKDSGRDIALIGVDADFYESDPSTQEYVLTSILKAMDVSVYDAIVAAAGGDTNTDTYVGTLENGGVGLAPLHNFEDRVDPELWQEVQDLQQQIISGELEVTSYLAG
ncbi:MAG: BMP family ABC transporter substrate-binding protein [bacterium]|nr:BMP family ABC transporter substrate-binding protein [bacterium]